LQHDGLVLLVLTRRIALLFPLIYRGASPSSSSLIHLSHPKSVPEGPPGLPVSARVLLLGLLTPEGGSRALRHDGDRLFVQIAKRQPGAAQQLRERLVLRQLASGALGAQG